MLMLKLSSELADGEHWTPVKTKSEAMEQISAWLDGFENGEMIDGDGFEVEIIEMSEKEFEALPDI